MKWAGRIGVSAGVIVMLGCDSDRLSIGPPSPATVSTPFTLPPIRGTVRETNGGPINEVVQVQMSGSAGVFRVVDSDAHGGFFFPYSSNRCGVGSVEIGLDYSDYYSANYNYLLAQPTAVKCTNEPSPSEVNVEVKVQRYASVTVGRPIETVLTNDDLYWPTGEAGEGPCGPCKVVELVLPSRVSALTIDWSGPDPLRASVTGWDDPGRLRIIFGQQTAAPGTHQLKFELPASPATSWKVATLKVGLANSPGTAGRLSDSSTLHIDFR